MYVRYCTYSGWSRPISWRTRSSSSGVLCFSPRKISAGSPGTSWTIRKTRIVKIRRVGIMAIKRLTAYLVIDMVCHLRIPLPGG